MASSTDEAHLSKLMAREKLELGKTAEIVAGMTPIIGEDMKKDECTTYR